MKKPGVLSSAPSEWDDDTVFFILTKENLYTYCHTFAH